MEGPRLLKDPRGAKIQGSTEMVQGFNYLKVRIGV